MFTSQPFVQTTATWGQPETKKSRMSVQRSRHDREAGGAGREASPTFCQARVTFCPLCALFGVGGDEAAFRRTRRMTSMRLYSQDATDVWSASKASLQKGIPPKCYWEKCRAAALSHPKGEVKPWICVSWKRRPPWCLFHERAACKRMVTRTPTWTAAFYN